MYDTIAILYHDYATMLWVIIQEPQPGLHVMGLPRQVVSLSVGREGGRHGQRE